MNTKWPTVCRMFQGQRLYWSTSIYLRNLGKALSLPKPLWSSVQAWLLSKHWQLQSGYLRTRFLQKPIPHNTIDQTLCTYLVFDLCYGTWVCSACMTWCLKIGSFRKPSWEAFEWTSGLLVSEFSKLLYVKLCVCVGIGVEHVYLCSQLG